MPVVSRCSGRLLLLGLLLAPVTLPAQGSSYEQLQTFSSLLNQIRVSYVDSVNYAELVHAAIDGVLGALDPHSRFLSQRDAAREAAYESGDLAGTGLVLDEVDGQLTVLTVLPRTPGARAGVSAGDRLLAVNDTAVRGLGADEVAHKLIGDKGSKVRLLLERGSRLEPDTFRIGLKLDLLKAYSVGLVRMLDPTTGYLRLEGFEEKAANEVTRGIQDLRGKGAKRLVLDLRGNPGGLVFAAVEIAGLFLPDKTLVFRTEGRTRSAVAEFRTEKDGQFRDLPLMVLIDAGSASASEALAGSLQDHDRALLLGRRSFGKALMQRPFPIPPQGDVVMLTIGHVITPSGRYIQRAYRGLRAQQYRSFAGVSGAAADTTTVYWTDHRREVRGGGGIMPDVPLPRAPALPGWWSVAADSGWYEAIGDSVAGLLPRDPAARLAWYDATAEWQTRLVDPFLARVRSRLQVAASPDDGVRARLGRGLAYRAAEVRWGAEAAEEMALHVDPDIRAAMGYWDRLPAMLAGH